MKIIKETKWQEAADLHGKIIMIKTIWEKDKNGNTYSRRIAVVKK